MSATMRHSGGTMLCCVPASIWVMLIFTGPKVSDSFGNENVRSRSMTGMAR